MRKELITKLEFNKLYKKPTFFIGWYNKFSHADNYTCVVIAGFVKSKGVNAIGFVQFFDNLNIKSKKQIYDFNDCSVNLTDQKIKIGSNVISLKSIKLELDNVELSLMISKQQPYTYKGLGKNILGPLHYIPFVECKHSILNIKSRFTGKIFIEGKTNNLTGECYQEKDWGTSFPEEYFWIQANKFNNKDITFQFAYAKPKWLLFKPTTYIGFLMIDNRKINLNGIGNTKIRIDKLNAYVVRLSLTHKKYIIKIRLKSGPTTELKGPLNGEMKKVIKESLSSELTIKVYDRKPPFKVHEYNSLEASSEIYL